MKFFYTKNYKSRFPFFYLLFDANNMIISISIIIIIDDAFSTGTGLERVGIDGSVR